MSAITMTRKCIHCHRVFTINPSVGNFGHYCKYCLKPQIKPLPISKKGGAYHGILQNASRHV